MFWQSDESIEKWLNVGPRQYEPDGNRIQTFVVGGTFGGPPKYKRNVFHAKYGKHCKQYVFKYSNRGQSECLTTTNTKQFNILQLRQLVSINKG